MCVLCKCDVNTLLKPLSKMCSVSPRLISSLKDLTMSTAPAQMMRCSSPWLKLTPCTTLSCLILIDPLVAKTMTTPVSRMASLMVAHGTACQEVRDVPETCVSSVMVTFKTSYYRSQVILLKVLHVQYSDI